MDSSGTTGLARFKSVSAYTVHEFVNSIIETIERFANYSSKINKLTVIGKLNKLQSKQERIIVR